ncbi:MAG: alpha-glucosidase C-terminal domain-containing protein, partial [Lachnospiraceae bacterium]|nr:alpha-glucosidase C-terminal domain-containing protein [Lachnospiraceae bacterium]
GVTIEEAKKYAGFDTRELSMVFQFEHMGVDSDENGKWMLKGLDLPLLKQIMSKWQTELEGKAWNSLFWDNHDQPRIVSRWGNDSEEYHVISAKMLATCLHMMEGTPYIYQGEEMGMTNPVFHDISECDDIEEINLYRELVTETGSRTKEEVMEIISRKGRDTARTPMQWDDSANAGFSTGRPWMMVNPNYTRINAASQISDPESVYQYYRKLIALRKENDIIVYGSYELLAPEDENLYIYTRTLGEKKLLVICNFSGQEQTLPAEAAVLVSENQGILIGNYDAPAADGLRPYEAVVYWLSES